jgi:hypothetical protein
MFCHTTALLSYKTLYCHTKPSTISEYILYDNRKLYCHTKPNPKKNLKKFWTLLKGWYRLDAQPKNYEPNTIPDRCSRKSNIPHHKL